MINYNDRPDDTVSKGSTPSTTAAPTPAAAFTPTLSQKSDDGSFNKVQFDGAGGVTVSGVEREYVSAVFVVGDRPKAIRWVLVQQANVSGQHWQADVATDPRGETIGYWAAY